MADKNFFETIGEGFKNFNLTTEVEEAITLLERYSTEMNKTFGQTKERLGEIMTVYADAIPRVTRLGGDVTDTFKTFNEIAKSTRRNVVANEESVARLFAASQVLNESVSEITDGFADVGVSFASIPDQLEDAVNYIRSIAGNTEQIMKNVTWNMDRLNRFQFEGGVVGLTKMAAQSSLLRFNMSETFQLADKVISPEGAVEVAAAFQRLGVTAGNLVDPFQLMNQSINDPQGLQDSLINVAKQFSYFDEKTKTFKINPQGVLMLREIESQTGVSAREMSKAAVAAGELERRLSKISQAGLNIEEDDKQYLANIAQMTKEGEYTVNLRSEFGEMVTKNLEDLTQTEFENLIKEQKSGGKTLEDVARNQLTTGNLILAEVRSIKETGLFGVAGSSILTDTMAGISRSLQNFMSPITQSITESGVRKDVDKAISETINITRDLYKQFKSGDLNLKDIGDAFEKATKGIENISDKFSEGALKAIKEGFNKVQDITSIEKKIIQIGQSFLAPEKIKDAKLEYLQKNFDKLDETSKKFLLGEKNADITKIDANTKLTDTISKQTTLTGQIDLKGNINVNITLPPDFTKLSETQQNQMFDKIFNSEELRNKITSVVSDTQIKKTGNK